MLHKALRDRVRTLWSLVRHGHRDPMVDPEWVGMSATQRWDKFIVADPEWVDLTDTERWAIFFDEAPDDPNYYKG